MTLQNFSVLRFVGKTIARLKLLQLTVKLKFQTQVIVFSYYSFIYSTMFTVQYSFHPELMSIERRPLYGCFCISKRKIKMQWELSKKVLERKDRISALSKRTDGFVLIGCQGLGAVRHARDKKALVVYELANLTTLLLTRQQRCKAKKNEF